jgi:hypothetical protein
VNRLTLALLAAAAVIAGCKCVGPEIIPDNTGDSVIMLSLKEQIEKNSKIDTGYGWVIWYIPVLILVVAWTWREYVKKHPVCDTCETEKSKALRAWKRTKDRCVETAAAVPATETETKPADAPQNSAPTPPAP